MAKVKRNPIMRGVQGSIGGLVFREMPGGETWVSGTPNFDKRKFSQGQKSHQSRFQEAAAYAREAAKREPIYAELAAGTVKSPYNFALSDWFHPPVIHEVIREAGLVRVRASDNIKVARVRVSALGENGKVTERREAVQVDSPSTRFTSGWWECACDGMNVKVEVWDLAGNRVEWGDGE